MRRMAATIAIAMTSACGLGADEGGGSEALPTAGLGPYGKIADTTEPPSPSQEPYVVSDLSAHLSDPVALPLSGGGFRIWYTRIPRRDDAGEPGIYMSDIPSLHDLPTGEPLAVLLADEAWEGEVVRAPSVLDRGGEIAMFYEGGEDPPQIAIARSTDGGLSWGKQGPLFEGRSPTAVMVEDGSVFVYFTRPDRSGIFAATLRLEAPDAATIVEDPVLDRRSTSEQAFDRVWIGDPAAAGGVTAAGERWIALFYGARDAEGRLQIGVAASHDGVSFLRARGGEPILEPGERDEWAPSALLYPSRGVLFFTQKLANADAIAAATSP
jgi:hypothetical protein